MTDYDRIQLVYVVIAGAISGNLWWLLTRIPATKPPVRRYVATGAIIGLLCAVSVVLLLFFLGEDKSKLFAPIAVTFYAGGFWLPGMGLQLTLTAMFRRQSDVSLRSGLIVTVLAGISLTLAARASWIEPNDLRVRTERVEVSTWNAGTPLRIVHVSDLQTVGPCERDREASRLINAQKPDLIVMTGDYFAGPYTDPWPAIDSARQFLGELEAPLGVILVRGHCVPRRFFPDLLHGLDHVMLVNATHHVDLADGRRLRIDGLAVYDADLSIVSPGDDTKELSIVASHVPDVTPDLTGRGVDLHLAGHTHGGQIVIPGFGAPLTLSSLPRRYARGLFRWEDHWLHVTAGIGMEGHHAPHVRLFCPPEICLLEIVGTAP